MRSVKGTVSEQMPTVCQGHAYRQLLHLPELPMAGLATLYSFSDPSPPPISQAF